MLNLLPRLTNKGRAGSEILEGAKSVTLGYCRTVASVCWGHWWPSCSPLLNLPRPFTSLRERNRLREGRAGPMSCQTNRAYGKVLDDCSTGKFNLPLCLIHLDPSIWVVFLLPADLLRRKRPWSALIVNWWRSNQSNKSKVLGLTFSVRRIFNLNSHLTTC